MKSLTVLLVGDFSWPWYHEASAAALERLGHRVIRYGWNHKFRHWDTTLNAHRYHSFFHRLQYRFIAGPLVRSVNDSLIAVAHDAQPDVIFFYNVQLIFPQTVQKLKRLCPNAVLCQYANDNPFSKRAAKSVWRYFIGSIPYFDLHYAYREDNIAQLKSAGARKVYLLRSYFVPEYDYPIDNGQIGSEYQCDVVFAGHYEDDGRVDALESICNAGYNLKLYGGLWDSALPKLSDKSPLRQLYPIKPVTGIHYNQALCGAKIALCFLSTLNCDTYTRRNFQIPAMKVPVLSQRTADLSQMFIEDKEISFFSTVEELLGKIRWLMSDARSRKLIGERGYQRVHKDGHDVDSRMHFFIQTVNRYRADCYE